MTFLTTTSDAPLAFLQDLACSLTPAVVAVLARTGVMRAAQLAEIVSTDGYPEEKFAALASVAQPEDIEDLWRVAGAHPVPKIRLGCLAALLGTAPDRHGQVLASLPTLKETERIWVLARAFAHLSAEHQGAALAEAAELSNFSSGAALLAGQVRPAAFRGAWDLIERTLPQEVGARARLVGIAPAEERALLVAQLVPAVRASQRLGHSAIRFLSPHAAVVSRHALIRQALLYDGSYAASNIASVLGSALRDPEVEARYVTLLDLGLHDYQWDRVTAYAQIAEQRGPSEEYCRRRATSLLDLLLGLPTTTTEPLKYKAVVQHQLNCLLAVTLALDGEERERRALQTLELLARIGPALSVEDMVPIAWRRAAHLHPRFDEKLLDLVCAIREDQTAFEALVVIADAAPRLEAACLERLSRRLEQRWAGRHLPVEDDS